MPISNAPFSHRLRQSRPLLAKGFSIIETLVALALLVLLTMVIAAIYKYHNASSKDSGPSGLIAPQAESAPGEAPVRAPNEEAPPLRSR